MSEAWQVDTIFLRVKGLHVPTCIINYRRPGIDGMNTHFPVFTLYSLNVSSPPAVTRVSPRSSNDSPVICIGDDCLPFDDSACGASTALVKTLEGLKRLCEDHISRFSYGKMQNIPS